jgi:hypothetical protein
VTAPPDIADRADELTGLIPALAEALERDNAPAGGRAVLSAGAPYNLDVLAAGLMLDVQVPAMCATAAGLCGEPWRDRPLDTCLRNLPRFHGRLTSLGMLSGAKRIESSVERWVRVVKLALGLRTPDIPVGWDCPWCDEPSPLIVIGSEGFLRPDQTVTWQHAAAIWCPACGTTWPDSQWEHLGRFLASV